MTSSQPRVRRNEWGSLLVPPLGQWEPHLSVSLVMPAYGAHRTLPYVLAGLAEQTYPSHLMELIVVDDGAAAGQPPLELPEVAARQRPDHPRRAGLGPRERLPHRRDGRRGRRHPLARRRHAARARARRGPAALAPRDRLRRGARPQVVRRPAAARRASPRRRCARPSRRAGWPTTSRARRRTSTTGSSAGTPASTTCAPSVRAPCGCTSARPRRWPATSTSPPAAWTPRCGWARTSRWATGSARRARCSSPTARPGPGTSAAPT